MDEIEIDGKTQYIFVHIFLVKPIKVRPIFRLLRFRG